MIEAILAIAGSLIGAWLWWLRNRAKTRQQKTDYEIEERNEQRKKRLMAGFVGLIAMLSGLIVSSCATSQTLSYSYPIPSEQDIGKLILEWDEIEKKQGQAPMEFTTQYAKALKALSDAIAEGERWRARAEDK